MLYLFTTSADELVAVQKLCRRNIQAHPVAKLKEIFSYHPVVEKLYPLLHVFFTIFETFRSDITSKIWTQVCRHDMASLQDLVEVWPTFTARLQEMVANFGQLKVPCGEADELMSTGTSAQQLRTVIKGLKACSMQVVDIDVEVISSKVRLYGGLQAVAKVARQLLCVATNFELQGDFSRVYNIADVRKLYANMHDSFNSMDFLTLQNVRYTYTEFVKQSIFRSYYSMYCSLARFHQSWQKSLSVSWMSSMEKLQSS